LFAGYEIEQALGNDTQARKYLSNLKKNFPSSELIKNVE
jgi:Tfp pilus assembly protein PilF